VLAGHTSFPTSLEAVQMQSPEWIIYSIGAGVTAVVLGSVFWQRETVVGQLRYVATGAAAAMLLASIVPRQSVYRDIHDYLQQASMLGFLWHTYKTKQSADRTVHTVAVVCTVVLLLLDLMELFVVNAHFPPSVNMALGRISPLFQYVAVYGVMACVFKRAEFLSRGPIKAYPASSVTRLRTMSPHPVNATSSSGMARSSSPAPTANTPRGGRTPAAKRTPAAPAAASTNHAGRSPTPSKKGGRAASPAPKSPRSSGRRTSVDTTPAKSPAARGRGSASGRKRSRSRS